MLAGRQKPELRVVAADKLSVRIVDVQESSRNTPRFWSSPPAGLDGLHVDGAARRRRSDWSADGEERQRGAVVRAAGIVPGRGDVGERAIRGQRRKSDVRIARRDGAPDVDVVGVELCVRETCGRTLRRSLASPPRSPEGPLIRTRASAKL